MENNYQPDPLDTEGIVLGNELMALVELLSENAHEIWAQQRMKDGWTFGPKRCDESLRHPCLVPYSELPEAEKIYDRNAVIGTVRAILALGFAIEKRVSD
jgi:RyR domain